MVTTPPHPFSISNILQARISALVGDITKRDRCIVVPCSKDSASLADEMFFQHIGINYSEVTSPHDSYTSPSEREQRAEHESTLKRLTEEILKNNTTLSKLENIQNSSLSLPLLLSVAGIRHPGKMRKRRTTFTREQLANMEKMFQKHPYLTPGQRADLAKSLKLAQIQVQVWFQNRRAKCKKTGI